MAEPAIPSEEVVEQWRSRGGHTTSMVKVTEDHGGKLVWGFGLQCSQCGWLPGGGDEFERDLVAKDAKYHVDWHNGE